MRNITYIIVCISLYFGVNTYMEYYYTQVNERSHRQEKI